MPRLRSSTGWTFAISAIGLFMVALDNLVVTTALPVIRRDLGASLQQLEWMVNAYTLTFAVLLLTGAALGDRFGRRRMFVIGLIVFTAGSLAAALAPNSEVLIVARAVQGIGGAIVTPLSLTILSAAVPPERRALALGAWGGIAGLAIAIGPLVGGAIAQGLNWHWIFLLNVPIGIVATVFAYLRLEETYGPEGGLDIPGLGLASAGLLGIVWGVINGNDRGWTDPAILAAIGVGALLLVGFVVYEARAKNPMLPMDMFRSRAFAAANTSSLLMYFGMFGSVFLLSQFFQVVQGYNPFESGLRVLPWTAMPIVVAPLAGYFSGRIGARPILVVGLALMSLGSPGSRPSLRRPPRTPRSWSRSSSAASAWACSSRRSPTSSCRPFGRRRRARRRARTTPSARSAACSVSPCWRRCSRPTARTRARRPSSMAWSRPCGWGPRSSAWRPSWHWRSRAGSQPASRASTMERRPPGGSPGAKPAESSPVHIPGGRRRESPPAASR